MDHLLVGDEQPVSGRAAGGIRNDAIAPEEELGVARPEGSQAGEGYGGHLGRRRDL